jgi:hypothetical protein
MPKKLFTEKREALCIEAEQLEGAMYYRFELHPPCEFQGVVTTHFEVIRNDKQTQIIADNKSWQSIGLTEGRIPLHELLVKYYGYHEPLVSRLYRIRGRWGEWEKPPIDYVPYPLARLWDELSEEQRLIVIIMAAHAAEEIEQAVKAATTDTWEHEDWGDE